MDVVRPIELHALGAGSRSSTMPPTRDASPDSSTLRLQAAQDQSKEEQATSLPPADGGKGAWLFCGVAFFYEMMIWGYSFAFGTVQLYLYTHEPFKQSSLASIGAVGTVALALEYMLPLALISVFRRYPDWVKTMLWVATFVSCGSMLISSWATQVWHLIILQGVLCGVSGAVMYTSVLIWLNEWFVAKRGTASGVIFAGTGVGGFVFPFVLGSCLDSVGFAWTCRIWALMSFVVFAGCAATIRPRLPYHTPAKGESRGPWAPRGLDYSFMWNPSVLMMCAITFSSSLSFFPIAVDLPVLVESISSPLQANTVLAVFNAAAVFGQVFIGYLSDKFDPSWIVGGIGVGSCISAFLALGFANDLGKAFGFCILYGIFSAICSTWSAVAREVSGGDLRIATTVFSIFGIFRGIASIVGPLIAASLYKEEESELEKQWGGYGFEGIIIFVGVMAAISALLGIGLRATKHMKTQ